MLAVHTGVEPAATVQPQVAVNRKQYATGIGASQNAAVCLGVNMYQVIQIGVSSLAFNTEILHKTQTEAFCCGRIVANINLAATGHHHS